MLLSGCLTNTIFPCALRDKVLGASLSLSQLDDVISPIPKARALTNEVHPEVMYPHGARNSSFVRPCDYVRTPCPILSGLFFGGTFSGFEGNSTVASWFWANCVMSCSEGTAITQRSSTTPLLTVTKLCTRLSAQSGEHNLEMCHMLTMRQHGPSCCWYEW